MSPQRPARAAQPGASLSGSFSRVLSGLGPRILLSAEGAAGAGDAGAGGEGDAGAAGTDAGADKGGGAEAPQRPDGIPDQFWDDKVGVKFADLKTHLDEVAAYRASEESRKAAIPEKPDGYELKLPADLKFADGEGFELNPDDPMFAFGREVAHAAGLDQAGFEKLVGMYAQREIAQAKEIQALVAKQIEALGPKGAERQGAVKTFLAAKLGKDAPAVFEPVLMLKNGVEMMERLMRVSSSGGLPGFSQGGREGGKTAPSEDEYAAMSPADRLVAARKAANGGR